ncbi:hypothetical protein [Streptomyces alboflavus]|uniref:hypothetical protein n=1 Tax=Streptomyces alboflavus TaxID=67267 RepID=UPI0004BEE254|nr:hypothetical protein [Streptomyces alboflavus]
MTAQRRSALGIARTESGGEPLWALVGEGALARLHSDKVTTAELEALPLDQREVDRRVEHLMAKLEAYCSHSVTTPEGAEWLYVQHVPVRRLVTQLVRKLLALHTWTPFARSPGPLSLAPYEGLIGIRDSSSREYRAYTVTWSGVAYVLGAPAPYNPTRSALLRKHLARTQAPEPALGPSPSTLPRADVVGLSWSSRHAGTLLPVLEKLAQDGRRSVLVDLATDPAERCPAPVSKSVVVHPASPRLFDLDGAFDQLPLQNSAYDGSRTVDVHDHAVRLDRLAHLAAGLVQVGGGCTQPSWRSVVRVETWLKDVLTAARPHTVVVSNDTSPLGALAVHMSERHGINTVHLQHGAWAEDTVAWPALHSRHIVVMGERDVAMAKAWVRHPEAEIHVLGQPRFDALTSLGREAQRRYMRKLLSTGKGRRPDRIAVWACQPFGPERLRAHADLILDGLWRADGSWGLIVAPHPAQSMDTFDRLLERDGEPLAAVADPRVGARGCLAGADVVASAYSTCGIEAALLNIPVLEVGRPGERTLGLADHGLARRCTSADEVADALAALRGPRPRTVHAAADAVCRWRGDSTAEIARLILDRADAARPTPDHHDAPGAESGLPQGEGASAQ